MKTLIPLLVAGLCLSFCNCKKEQTREAPTPPAPTITDTILGLLNDTTTTFIVLRHAEKESTGSDPNLDSNGVLRAEELKRILNSVPVQSIYSTPYNRTRQTVQPLAASKGISVTEYPTSKPYATLVSEIRSANDKKVSVIAGHSNTVPEILKQVSQNTFNITINDSQYDFLFIVGLHDHSAATITTLRYGKATP